MDARHVLGGADPLGAELAHHRRPVRAVRQRDDVHEPRARVVGVVRTERLDVEARQQPPIPLRGRRAELEHPVELLELRDPDRSLNVGPAVVEAEAHMVEPGAALVVAPLVAQAAKELPLLLRVGKDDTALTGRDLLVRVEAEHAGNAVAADGPALVLGAERFRGVLDQGEAVPLADCANLVELARVPEHVHGDDRLRPGCDRGLERGRVEIQRARVDVCEDGRRALDDEAVRRGRERDRRGDRLVARL